MAVALLLSALCAAAAFGCRHQAVRLGGEAQWHLERGAAEGAEYAATFENVHAEAQLVALAERRTVLDRMHLWMRAHYLLILFAVAAALSSYVLFLVQRLRLSLESVEHAAR